MKRLEIEQTHDEKDSKLKNQSSSKNRERERGGGGVTNPLLISICDCVKYLLDISLWKEDEDFCNCNCQEGIEESLLDLYSEKEIIN